LLAILRVIDADMNFDAKYGTNAPFLHLASIIGLVDRSLVCFLKTKRGADPVA